MRKSRSIFATALAVAMSFTMCMPAFAAEPDNKTVSTEEVIVAQESAGSEIMPLNTGGWCTEVKGIGSTYKDVAYAGSGFNCNVRLVMSVPTGYVIDVAMYNGANKVWEEQNAFNGERVFWAGNDVTSIRVRARPILGGGSIVERTFTCGVDVFGS